MTLTMLGVAHFMVWTVCTCIGPRASALHCRGSVCVRGAAASCSRRCCYCETLGSMFIALLLRSGAADASTPHKSTCNGCQGDAASFVRGKPCQSHETVLMCNTKVGLVRCIVTMQGA